MLPIKITRRASAQIREAAIWWSANRQAAPRLLPHLSRIRQFLYYRVRGEQIEILALWHLSRGEDPGLYRKGTGGLLRLFELRSCKTGTIIWI